jgi:hypothetical protein
VAVVVDSYTVYWWILSSSNILRKHPLWSGAGDDVLNHGGGPSSSLFPRSLALDDSRLYWSDADENKENGEVFSIRKDKTDFTSHALALRPTSVAVAPGWLFWTSWVDKTGSVAGMETGGGGAGGAAGTVKYSGRPLPFDVAVAGDTLLWTETCNPDTAVKPHAGGVFKAPVNGLGTVDLVHDCSENTDTDYCPVHLAVYDGHVYWTQRKRGWYSTPEEIVDNGGGNSGSVARAALDGSEYEVLAVDQDRPWDVAVDGCGVYWTNEGSDDVMFKAHKAAEWVPANCPKPPAK